MKIETLEPGWYRVRIFGETLFREKRKGIRYFYNQTGFTQFHVSDYEILDKVTLSPMKKGVKYV